MNLLLESLISKVKIDPNPRVYFRICEEYKKKSDVQNVLQYGLDGLEKNPNYVPLLLSVGRSLKELERWNEAIPHFQKVLNLDAENTKATFGLAFCFIMLGYRGEAEPFIENLSFLRPELVEELRQLSSLHAEKEIVEDMSRAVNEPGKTYILVDDPGRDKEDTPTDPIQPDESSLEASEPSVSDESEHGPQKLDRLRGYLNKIRRNSRV